MSDNPDSLPPDDADAYYLSIESHFAARRGAPFIASAKEWALMKEWRSEGIPLPVIVEAIDFAFDKREAAGRRRSISSLSYCRHSVRDLWRERKELQAGESEALPESAPGPLLDSLAAELRLTSQKNTGSDVSRLLGEAASEVERLVDEKSVPRIEQRLIEIEDRLLASLLAALPPDERSAIERAIELELGRYAIADDEARRKTADASLRRELRRRFGIGRLSLFH